MPADQQVHISIFLPWMQNQNAQMQKQCAKICRSYAKQAPKCGENTFTEAFSRTWEDPGHPELQQSGAVITGISSRNSLPARVPPAASPCPRAITPHTSTCPSKMDLRGMESLWWAERVSVGTETHQTSFSEGSIRGRQMGVYISADPRRKEGWWKIDSAYGLRSLARLPTPTQLCYS